MPLRRYLIRNDYASSDPDLYRQADKDDPEALLESVSMSGLVGLLRQLGDLAEFAAEIFHDLHEGVLATASRGHGLMVRVQQLETEFPLVEKALLSHTNHSSFFYNTGADCHPSMRSQENIIAQGDLPRFIMDSYEECRPPPRLFLLDKFDVAGAGACLKRYSDPALFKEETVLEDMQKEKKIRRIKKKGLRGKNGATPEFMQVPHTKLHQLFLEERVEISNSGPSRLVKLKRRKFKESSFGSKNGKSYMEKFINTSSPDSKTVFEDPVSRPVLLWTSESILPDAVEIHSRSPMEIGLQLKDNASTGKYSLSENSFMEHLNEMLIDEKEMMEPASVADEETGGILDLHHLQEMQLAKIGKIQNEVNYTHYDEITSEVENYVDAVATLESEVVADSEFEARTSKCINKTGKHETDSVTTDEPGEHQRQFSDSQSWDYSVSDDGNTFIRRGSSTFSYSDGQSNLMDNILSDGDEVGRAFLSSDAGTSECILDNQISNILENTSEITMKPASNKEEGICTSALTTELSASLWPFLAEGASINQISPVFSSLDVGNSIEHVDGAVSSDIHSEKGKEYLSRRISENRSINVKEAGESIISLDPLQHPSTFLHLPDVAEIDNGNTRETFNIYGDVDNIDRDKCRSRLSSSAEGSSEDQLHLTDLSEVGYHTGLVPFHLSSAASIANGMDGDKPVSTAMSEDILPVAESNSECFTGKEDVLHINSKVQNYVVLDDTSANEHNESTYRCHDDVMKHAENLHAIVDDERAACTEAISGNDLASDLFIASNDDHLGSEDNAAMYPSSKAVSSAITSSCSENVSSVESLSADPASTSHPKMQELDPDPATSNDTDQKSNNIAGARGYTEEEEVFKEEQGLIQSDLKSPGGFTFQMEEQCSSLPKESLGLSDSQGIVLAVMDLEAKPARKSSLPLSSEADFLDNQLVEHEGKLEQPPEVKADASGVKLAYIEETNSESSTDNLEPMQSSSLLCQEDTLSKPGPPLESLPEVENHMLEVRCSKDNRVTTSLPCSGSDIVLPSDNTEDECSNIFKSYAEDHPSRLVCSKTLEEPALPESPETKEVETLVLRSSSGMIQEEISPVLSVDSKVHSTGEVGQLNSLNLSTVDQGPAPQSQSQANPVPSESKVLNSITALHREDSPEESLESVSDPMASDNSNKPSETILPNPQKSNFQSVWESADEKTEVVFGQPPIASFQREIPPAMSSGSSPISDSTEGQPLSGHSEADNGRLAAGSAQLEMKQDEPLLHGPPSFEGEIVALADGKIPRPPKRLIEAVAAHDRSMLRKVTERKRPPMEPQVNERDSLLEQIRTKSFNLKPALAARPSIQGPKTNLKVAAILEKANAIRQAFAGSDEDDDDSWSDS